MFLTMPNPKLPYILSGTFSFCFCQETVEEYANNTVSNDHQNRLTVKSITIFLTSCDLTVDKELLAEVVVNYFSNSDECQMKHFLVSMLQIFFSILEYYTFNTCKKEPKNEKPLSLRF